MGGFNFTCAALIAGDAALHLNDHEWAKAALSALVVLLIWLGEREGWLRQGG